MKVSNVSAGDSSSTSPAVKKLKQARLPFQIISSDATKPLSVPSKKRKLSEEHEESPNKIVKPSLISEAIVQEKSSDTVVISDEEKEKSETVECSEDSNAHKLLNPLVSIVDTALKRKLRKKSTPAKKKQKKSNKSVTNHCEEKISNEITEFLKVNHDDKSECVHLIEDSNDCEIHTQEEIKTADSSNLRIENKENIDEIVRNEELSSSPVLIEVSATNNGDSKDDTKCNENTEVSVSKTSPITEHKLEETPIEKLSESQCSSSHENDSSSDSSKNEESSDVKNELKTPVRRKREQNESRKFLTPNSNKMENSDTDSAKELSSSEKTRSSPRTPSVDSKKLTPKQIQKKLESTKKQQEREKEKQEKERKKQEEKDEKNRQRLEKEEQKKKEREDKEEQKRKEREEKERLKEQEKKEREEKEEAKRKDKEEKELQKKKEKEAKEEEKRKKEIEKEEEKRKKELEKEELESKKKKASVAFVNFFVPKTSKGSNEQYDEDVIKNVYLSNFTRKSDMRLAPVYRRHLNADSKSSLDDHLKAQEIKKKEMYICNIKEKGYDAGRSEKTWPLEDINNDVVIIEDELPMDGTNMVLEDSHKLKHRPKLLSFSENRRPPYWGTWRRTSQFITGRRPFGVDSKILDYECDSDEEWEEEEPGESVGGSDAGSDVGDDEEGDDYDVDNEFMVPHGYLSEEEAMGEEDEQILSPEIQKAKLKILQCEFENEMKKSTERLHPRLLGILWQKSDGSKPDSCSEMVWNFIGNRKILSQDAQIFIQPTVVNNDCDQDDAKNPDKPKKSRKIQEDMIPNLIRLVHGNTNSRGFLAHEFQTYVAKSSEDKTENVEEGTKTSHVDVSKMSIAKMIKEISKWMSCPEEGAMQGKTCWFVPKEIREKFSIEIELPNSWSYALVPKRRSEITKKDVCKTPQQKNNPELVKNVTKEITSEKKEGAFNITKFTKKLTQEERNKQFVNSNPPITNDNGAETISTIPQVKKRVSLLFSGPIGKSLPSSSSESQDPEIIEIKDKPCTSETKVTDNSKSASNVKSVKKTISACKGKAELPKKRVALISIPKGKESPKIIKTNLLTQFIKTIPNDSAKSGKNKKVKQVTPMETDDCVVLSD